MASLMSLPYCRVAWLTLRAALAAQLLIELVTPSLWCLALPCALLNRKSSNQVNAGHNDNNKKPIK